MEVCEGVTAGAIRSGRDGGMSGMFFVVRII